MEIFIISLKSTAELVFNVGSVMFISLFGIELLMQMGLMKYMKPFAKPIAKTANLPSESAVCFITSIGSMIAAHSMAAGFYKDGLLTEKELRLTGVLNTVAFHFKEILTFQLPVVLPLLGTKLSAIYIAAFILTGLIKLIYVFTLGRVMFKNREISDTAFNLYECSEGDENCVKRSFLQLLNDTFNARKKMFTKMMVLLFTVTMIIQILVQSGALKIIEKAVLPLTSLFSLPASVVGPVTAYIFSPTVGITYMSNLLKIEGVTSYQAITALLAGSLIMIPFTRIRRTLPRYTSIYGLKNGSVICGLTTALSMAARIIVLTVLIICRDYFIKII